MTGQYWAHRDQSVVHPSSLINVASLERQLKTTAAHAESHCIQVDVVEKGSTIFGLLQRQKSVKMLSLRVCSVTDLDPRGRSNAATGLWDQQMVEVSSRL